MKTLTKIEYVQRWLESGKTITRMQAITSHIRYTNLPDAIWELKQRGMWIINIGKPGKYAKYILLERGLIRAQLYKGFRCHIVDAHYINGLSDMEIHIRANNGHRIKDFTVNSDAFRSKKIMIKHLEDENTRI